MNNSWQPSASIATLKKRAELINQLRSFFAARNILEVETPLLAQATIPDPVIHSISANYQPFGGEDIELHYLQTSPEFAMKRLLAAGSGCIFQICKAFRNGEVGRFHNPEFTMLEWYRVGYGYQQLMTEVDELLQQVLQTQPGQMLSYQQVFINFLQLDPLSCSETELQQCAEQQGIAIDSKLSRDDWLNLLFSSLIEPKLGTDRPTFIYHYPASQAALSQVSKEDARVAERFEAFYQGYELANGFAELTDAEEQLSRFKQNLQQRKSQGIESVPIDENFIAALSAGLPTCAGVAMGIDRLLMLLLQKTSIKEVISFDFTRA